MVSALLVSLKDLHTIAHTPLRIATLSIAKGSSHIEVYEACTWVQPDIYEDKSLDQHRSRTTAQRVQLFWELTSTNLVNVLNRSPICVDKYHDILESSLNE